MSLSECIEHLCRQVCTSIDPIPNGEPEKRIGSGTGIFTRALLAHPEWSPSVKALRAVEPSEGMRSTFAKMVNDERVTLTEGTFDHTGVGDHWANVIVIAQVGRSLENKNRRTCDLLLAEFVV